MFTRGTRGDNDVDDRIRETLGEIRALLHMEATIELVQFESSRPGGFGPERQKETMAKAKAMFEAQGVEFDKFWAKVGGFKGMPGMDALDR